MMVDYHEKGNVGHIYGEGLGGFSARAFDIHGKVEGGRLVSLSSRPNPEYEKNPAVSTCTGEEWVRAWKVDDWNAAKVVCRGKVPRITTWINGLKVVEFDAESFSHPRYDKTKVAEALGPEGSIAVQVHGGKGAWPTGAKCRWRNIRIGKL
jgi:hypothetical protein